MSVTQINLNEMDYVIYGNGNYFDIISGQTRAVWMLT